MSVSRVVVVGAGVIGAWTAWHFRRAGIDVALVDAWGAANSRSTSGDETRILRVAYGDQPHYIDLTLQSIPQWDELSQGAIAPFFQRCGALWFFDEEDSYVTSSLPHLNARRIRIDRLDLRDAAKRFPQVNWSDVISAYHEPNAGFVLARKSVQAVAARLAAMGTPIRIGQGAPVRTPGGHCKGVKLSDGTTLEADAYVFASGPWLGQLFPKEIGPWLRPTRQELFYFGPPAGNPLFNETHLPAWIDGARESWYGIPGNEHRGFKISSNELGEQIDPTTLDRATTARRLALARTQLAHRFPGMAGAPVLESRVCQYENTPDRGFILDRLPGDDRVLAVGGGSGHAFKLGPALGELVARTVIENKPAPATYRLERFAKLDPTDDRHWHTDIKKP